MKTLTLLFALGLPALAALAGKPTVKLPFEGGEVLVTPNAPFTLRATVTGQPPFRFAWQKDGIELPVKTDELIFDRFSPAHDGRYTVVVSGTGGVAVSQPVHLVHAGAGAVFERQAKQAAQRPGTSLARPGDSPTQPSPAKDTKQTTKGKK